MESAMLVSPRPLLRARSALPRIAPSTITSMVMEDLRPKNMACSGMGEILASMIIAQWAAWRRQAIEQMLLSAALDLDRESLAGLQAVSTTLHASSPHARAAADDDGGSGRRAVVRQSSPSPGGSVGVARHVRRASQGKGDAHIKQRDTREQPRLCVWQVGRLVVACELQALAERHAVSAFVHRDCIESFLRGRFYFHGGWPMPDDEGSAVSMATSSTEDQSVNVENTLPNSDDEYRRIDQQQMYRYDNVSSDSAEYAEHGSSGSSSAILSEAATNYGQPSEGEDGAFLHGDGVIDSQQAAEPRLQPDQSFDPPSYNDWLDQPVDGFYGVELPELLSRRSVYNLLSDGFGERLGQLLIQSYARRQEHVDRQMLNTTASVTEDYVDNDINELNQAEYNRPWIVSSGQGPRRRQWYWTRPEFVLDAIKDLETDMVGLYNGMTSVQHMMEECMEMQMEVQRSIRQEVSAAMNRSTGIQGMNEGQLDDPSRGHLVRKGTCCICCENQIDSLLYRCGHMCTCSKCARELINEDEKCPMCRAPIVDVVRAYTT